MRPCCSAPRRRAPRRRTSRPRRWPRRCSAACSSNRKKRCTGRGEWATARARYFRLPRAERTCRRREIPRGPQRGHGVASEAPKRPSRSQSPLERARVRRRASHGRSRARRCSRRRCRRSRFRRPSRHRPHLRRPSRRPGRRRQARPRWGTNPSSCRRRGRRRPNRGPSPKPGAARCSEGAARRPSSNAGRKTATLAHASRRRHQRRECTARGLGVRRPCSAACYSRARFWREIPPPQAKSPNVHFRPHLQCYSK